jgi:hypothetical protein
MKIALYSTKNFTGHTRQGLRCRVCKVNAHADCASQLPKCQVKAKLLRRQKSTSEIENRIEQEEESEYLYTKKTFICHRNTKFLYLYSSRYLEIF